MGQLAIDQSARDDTDDLAAAGQGRIRDRAHHPDPAAAVDDADPARGEPRPDRRRVLEIGPPPAGAGATEDADPAHGQKRGRPSGAPSGGRPGRDARSRPSRRGVLAEGAAAGRLAGWLEDRVVAEAAAPARLDRDPAAAGPAAHVTIRRPPGGRGVRQREREHADVARARAPSARSRRAPRGAWRCSPRPWRPVAGVAARPDTRRAAERVDLEPGIVGQGRQAGGADAKRALIAGVGLERLAVLDRLAGDAEVVERDELDAGRAEAARAARAACGPTACATSERGGRRSPSAPGQRRTVASAVAWASNRRASPAFGQVEQGVDRRPIERLALGGALQLDVRAGVGADDVEVDLGVGVLGVVEVEQRAGR